MEKKQPSKALEDLARDSGVYPVDAFHFVREGLQFTVERVHGKTGGDPQHISGRDLCWGLRDLAVRRWGLLAPTVLSSWNIRTTTDFGHVVFAMVKAGWMAKTQKDTLDDFREIYNFGTAFRAEISVS